MRIYVTGMGVVSPQGVGVESLLSALQDPAPSFAPLTLFEAGEAGPLPAGQVRTDDLAASTALELPPRTHRLAWLAAQQALAGQAAPPDAVVLGGTTGGIPHTEAAVLAGVEASADFRLHGTGTVADYVAERCACQGPALTVSTACSSAAVALKLALQMLRSGRYRRVLAGGADALCRLTYCGFGLLQLIDPDGCHPLDAERAGMTVSEGAGMLLLEAAETAPPGARGLLLGGGLSCDAHHATAPHPEGAGAQAAMRAALDDGGLEPGQVDYINLHGTGTRDNDLSEARAVRALFGQAVPPLSSTKGIFGHPLAAAGAVEAVVSLVAMEQGLLPPNARLRVVDPDLDLSPVTAPRAADLRAVLSNSLGFGGNNASLLFARTDAATVSPETRAHPRLFVKRVACLTGAGDLDATWQALAEGRSAAGVLDGQVVVRDLPPRAIRRSKRLPRLVLALAQSALGEVAPGQLAEVFFGTGFGPLSETHDFLERLFASEQRLSSPTDFIGSVHNAPAGQVAMRYQARGANVTATGGDLSFEQALFMAGLLARGDGDALLVGADEHHDRLSPLFDRSVAAAGWPADGGAAFWLSADAAAGPALALRWLGRLPTAAPALAGVLTRALGAPAALAERVGLVLLGLPAAWRLGGQAGFDAWRGDHPLEVFDARAFLGEFATASAPAAALAVRAVAEGRWPGPTGALDLAGRSVLVLQLGAAGAALEIGP